MSDAEIEHLPLRERAKRKKAKSIREAAEALFSEKPFAEVTTKELAERAGVGEATLFRYMANKTELLLLVYSDKMDEAFGAVESQDAQVAATEKKDASSYLQRVYSVYEARCRFYLEDPENSALYLREGFRTDSALGLRAVEQGDRCIRLVESILQEGQDAGYILQSIDSELVAQNCHGIYMHEIDRAPVRGYTPESIWERVKARLEVQLEPLTLPGT
ncbi:TetR/AcrR family transcriptional regulator [Arthrobacter sp. 2MCAF15]|uniref:TetR/AcrR family transcriptional regulator n=1 Tax=Arthrobacter sp. 2MCAF15 TaxID=3232984 RepID=UPI003F8E50E7